MAGISPQDKDLALTVLEHDQLAGAKAKQVARRPLTGGETLLLWVLRIYVLFMMAVVIYQIVTGGH